MGRKNTVKITCTKNMPPLPKEPGLWEYLEEPSLSKYLIKEPKWKRARIVVPNIEEFPEAPEDSLLFYRAKENFPRLWPRNAKWRKIKE